MEFSDRASNDRRELFVSTQTGNDGGSVSDSDRVRGTVTDA